jgi:hypothetical protein
MILYLNVDQIPCRDFAEKPHGKDYQRDNKANIKIIKWKAIKILKKIQLE